MNNPINRMQAFNEVSVIPKISVSEDDGRARVALSFSANRT